MDNTIMYMVPPQRPEDFGTTAREFADRVDYTVDGARRVLDRQESLVCITMRHKGKRVSVYVGREVAKDNDWYNAWMK